MQLRGPVDTARLMGKNRARNEPVIERKAIPTPNTTAYRGDLVRIARRTVRDVAQFSHVFSSVASSVH